MTHMELPSDIGRGHHNGKGFLAPVHFGVEIFMFFPVLVDTVFDGFRVVSFG